MGFRPRSRACRCGGGPRRPGSAGQRQTPFRRQARGSHPRYGERRGPRRDRGRWQGVSGLRRLTGWGSRGCASASWYSVGSSRWMVGRGGNPCVSQGEAGCTDWRGDWRTLERLSRRRLRRKELVNCFRVWDHKRGLRRELRALEMLRRSVGSATMTTPMGRAHHLPTLDTGCRPL